MRISGTQYPLASFCASKKEAQNDKNPINKTGERATLLKATVGAGFSAGLFFLWELCDGDFVVDNLYDYGSNLVDKANHNALNGKKELRKLGVLGALVVGFVAAIAAIYTLAKTPEIMYKGKVNAFAKGKDMDVYQKGNAVEKELYDQMNEQAKGATEEEKEILKQQYLKLKAAKNQTPEFVESPVVDKISK